MNYRNNSQSCDWFGRFRTSLYFVDRDVCRGNKRQESVFKTLPRHLFHETKGLAANQGLYNGFLAAGLLWSFLISDIVWQHNIALFFLICVFVAGTFGAVTASPGIFVKHALPALTGIVLVLLS